MSNAELVVDFHRALGHDLPTTPTAPELPLLDLRVTLLREEFAEVGEELDRLRARIADGGPVGLADLAPLAHELTDLLYVTYGALAALGVPADELFAEVHRANLAKTTGPVRADGKQLKPPGWQPADVLGVLRAADR